MYFYYINSYHRILQRKNVSRTTAECSKRLWPKSFGTFVDQVKTKTNPQIRAVQSHPYTSECGLSAVHTSRVLAARHKIHSRCPFQKPAERSGRSFPTPSPPKVTSGGIALLDFEKAEALADSLQAQLQPWKTRPNRQSLKWFMRPCEHAR